MAAVIPKLVIFDVDGTLVDSLDQIVSTMGRAFAEHGLAPPAPNAVRDIVGRSLDLAVAELLIGEGRTEAAPAVAARYREIYALEVSGRPAPLHAGVGEMLIELGRRDDLLLAIATGKSRRGATALLAASGLEAAFATVQTADDAASKPHPDMVLKAMAATGVAPSATVMVGDSTLDMMMARAAGVRAIGVTWGSHPGDDLLAAGADRIVARVDALAAAIDGQLARASFAADA